MRQSFIDMHRNLSQIKRLPFCKIVNQDTYSFSAELSIRNGRYKLRLDYNEKKEPKVFIISPDIDMSSFIEIHTYGMHYHKSYKRKLPLLCLTHWPTDKWNSSISLVESYIPWAIEWTEFYEIWLLTNKWYGTGIHIESKEKQNNAA